MRFISYRTLCAIASLTLLAGTAGLPVLAQTNIPVQNPQTGASHRHKQNGGAWAKLNLTTAQQTKLAEIRKQERAELKGVLTPAQVNQMQAHKAKGANRRDIFASLNLTDAQKTQMRQIRKSYRQKMMAVLTPAQQTQLNQMRQERKGAHRGT